MNAEGNNGLKPTRVGRYAVGIVIAVLTIFIVWGMMFHQLDLEEWEQNVIIGLMAILGASIKDFVTFVLRGRTDAD